MAQTPETDRRPSKGRRTPGRRQISPIWFAVSLFALLLIVNLVQTTLRDGTTLTYSEFKDQLKQNRVSEVTMSAEGIHGVYLDANGKEVKFTTVPVDDPKLVEELEAQKVRFAGELQSRWVADLLTYALPILLIIGLWAFMLRRMG